MGYIFTKLSGHTGGTYGPRGQGVLAATLACHTDGQGLIPASSNLMFFSTEGLDKYGIRNEKWHSATFPCRVKIVLAVPSMRKHWISASLGTKNLRPGMEPGSSLLVSSANLFVVKRSLV